MMLAQYYEVIKAIHIIAVISWMAGMLYLPRIFVYHTSVKANSETSEVFKKMERRLMRFIMNPAIIIVYITGLLNAYIYGIEALGIWFHIKMGAVFILTLMHGLFARWRKAFERDQNILSSTFYRFINEVPTVMMIIAVFMVVLKP
ncbi:MAG: protoporphyrinogen oxidase HemJ [Rickettsiaceae bacterium]|nr:protoporphyrinogen oxidase HemJ [Rickettsiaceae bacterium]